MKILALDTSAMTCSVALCEDERLIGELVIDTGNTHSETLLPAVEQVLKITNTDIDDVEVFACTTGPGSFTGVRIGVATIKGIAFGKDKKCIGVSSPEALAYNLSCFEGIICPVIDARRDHMYNALFKYENGVLVRLCPDRLISISDLDAELAGITSPVYLCGDGYEPCKKKLSAQTENTSSRLTLPSAYSVAMAARKKYDAGEYTDDFGLAPVYLRPSQAERERAEKEKNKLGG